MRFAGVCSLLGWVLVLGAPLLGPIPGPGPLLILPIGLALILKNSLWAKKRYARAARRHPELCQLGKLGDAAEQGDRAPALPRPESRYHASVPAR